MTSKTTLSKIKAAYKAWFKDNPNITFYHPDLVEELVNNNKSIQDFDQILGAVPQIVFYRSFFDGWLNDEIDELNLLVLEEQFELGQKQEYIEAVMLNANESRTVLKSGERVELTAYGDSLKQNREVVAFVFKFTDGLLTSFEDHSDKAENYFQDSDDKRLVVEMDPYDFIEFLRSSNLLDLLTDDVVKQFYSNTNEEIKKIKKILNSTQYFATNRPTMLFNFVEININSDKVTLEEFNVDDNFFALYAFDEYLVFFQDQFNQSKFKQEEFTKMSLSTEETSNNLNLQTNISNKIQELFGLNEARALEQGANTSSSSGGWYSKKWLVYLLLVLFLPAGLYGLAKNKSISGVTKFIIYGILGFLIYTTYTGDVSNVLNNSVVTPVDSFQIDTTMGPSFIFNNKAKDTIVVAYGYKYKKGVRSIGWYQIKPDSSIQFPIPTDLANDALYWYAESFNGSKWVGKDKKFCIDHLNAFDIKKKKTTKCEETAIFTQRLLTQTYNTIDIQ